MLDILPHGSGADCSSEGWSSLEFEGSGAAFNVPCLFLVNTLRKISF